MRAATDFVSLAEAADRKGVHYQTVRRAIRRGDLKATKVGGGVLIAAGDLDLWQPKHDHAPHMYRRTAVQDIPGADRTTSSVKVSEGGTRADTH